MVVVQGRSLVGREPELTALAELVEDTDAGRGRVALITGEAGIGLTLPYLLLRDCPAPFWRFYRLLG